MLINDFIDGKHIKNVFEAFLQENPNIIELNDNQKNSILFGYKIEDFIDFSKPIEDCIDNDKLSRNIPGYFLNRTVEDKKYLFIGNKSALKKEMDFLVPSLFDSLFLEMKNKDVILRSTSKIIVFQNINNLSEVNVKTINFSDDIKDAKSFITSYNALVKNNTVIAKYCSELEEENRLLKQEVEDLRYKIQNTNLSTWA